MIDRPTDRWPNHPPAIQYGSACQNAIYLFIRRPKNSTRIFIQLLRKTARLLKSLSTSISADLMRYYFMYMNGRSYIIHNMWEYHTSCTEPISMCGVCVTWRAHGNIPLRFYVLIRLPSFSYVESFCMFSLGDARGARLHSITSQFPVIAFRLGPHFWPFRSALLPSAFMHPTQTKEIPNHRGWAIKWLGHRNESHRRRSMLRCICVCGAQHSFGPNKKKTEPKRTEQRQLCVNIQFLSSINIQWMAWRAIPCRKFRTKSAAISMPVCSCVCVCTRYQFDQMRNAFV